jgi:TrmH family RNA methyltransferase
VPLGPELTSIRSPRVQAARRLGKRAFRTREGRFLAEGPQAVREAAGRPGTVTEVFVTRDAADRHADLVAAAGREAPVHLVSGEVMSALAQTVTPQGVVAVCRTLDQQLDDVLATRPSLVAVLAHARDPGNAGTVLRTADAAGADLPAMRAAGLRVLAADGHADIDLDAAADGGLLDGPTAWVFGNEAWGLPEETRSLADAVVKVPIHGRAESLNLATAAAVCLYASARAQRAR